MVDKNLMYSTNDVGKKVYQLEYETTYVTKWQIVAKDKDEAFDIWLAEHKQDIKVEDSAAGNCVCTYVKDYSQLGDTKEIAEIKQDEELNEVIVE